MYENKKIVPETYFFVGDGAKSLQVDTDRMAVINDYLNFSPKYSDIRTMRSEGDLLPQGISDSMLLLFYKYLEPNLGHFLNLFGELGFNKNLFNLATANDIENLQNHKQDLNSVVLRYVDNVALNGLNLIVGNSLIDLRVITHYAAINDFGYRFYMTGGGTLPKGDYLHVTRQDFDNYLFLNDSGRRRELFQEFTSVRFLVLDNVISNVTDHKGVIEKKDFACEEIIYERLSKLPNTQRTYVTHHIQGSAEKSLKDVVANSLFLSNFLGDFRDKFRVYTNSSKDIYYTGSLLGLDVGVLKI